MDSACSMELAALGRPFSLGMLYDMRNDSLVTGMTLWDEDALTEHIQTTQQNYNAFEIITSDSLQSKSSKLNVNASLKLGILSGKVKVEGSGNYLNESKTSKHQERVTLMYKETKLFKQLSMYQLGNIKYLHVIDTGLATHVVTGILYGGQAFFVFDREVSEDENHQDIHGDLEITIKKIPKFAGQARGDMKMDNEDLKKVDQFSCRFFGDVCLDKSPTTFQEAIETFKSLPELLKDGEKAVPITVFMLPLTTICPSASKLVRQISEGLVHDAQAIMEDFIKLEMRCNDALKTSTLQPFPQCGEKLKCFKDLCAELKLEFQQTLAEKLPLIRGGEGEEAELAKILKKRHCSPFNSKKLNQWIDEKEKEMYILEALTNMMKNTTFIQSEPQLYKEVLNAEQVVCFVFTGLGSDEPFLSTLSAYLKRTRQDHQGQHLQVEQWNSTTEKVKEIKKKCVLFSDFAEANKENKKIKFLAMADNKDKSSNIYLYNDGFPADNFEPPLKPEAVTVHNINHNCVTLKVSFPSDEQKIRSYSVEVQVDGEKEWKQKTECEGEELVVNNLKPNTKYVFRCREVSSVGVGPARVSDPITTLSEQVH